MDNQPVGCAGHRRRQRHVAFVLPLRGTKHPHLARLGARTHPHTHRTTRSTSGSGQGALQSWPNVDPGTDRGARPSQCHSKFLQDVKGLNPCEVPYNVKIVELPQEYPYLRKGPLPARIPRNPALGVPRGGKGQPLLQIYCASLASQEGARDAYTVGHRHFRHHAVFKPRNPPLPPRCSLLLHISHRHYFECG